MKYHCRPGIVCRRFGARPDSAGRRLKEKAVARGPDRLRVFPPRSFLHTCSSFAIFLIAIRACSYFLSLAEVELTFAIYSFDTGDGGTKPIEPRMNGDTYSSRGELTPCVQPRSAFILTMSLPRFGSLEGLLRK